MSSSAPMSASHTSFAAMFGRELGELSIEEVEIPLIQRDYAQGRKTENVSRIRQSFIDVLCGALLPGADTIDLDFVFGDVDHGKFNPLDGQQRLTTLFLLHCYLAWRTGVAPQNQPWSRFSYSTRPGARDFCAFLVGCVPDSSVGLSDWIEDQADYLPTWRHDPTIQSMLVVLDALHEWYQRYQPDMQAAWSRLVDDENPAIRFHILPMKSNGLTDALYIKMNSRGRPLTPFENFKAQFEELLKRAHPSRAGEFARKVDSEWSDVLWPYRGEDHLIDDDFMRYFRFCTEVGAWKADIDFHEDTRDEDLAELVYGVTARGGAESLTFLFQAFDVWVGRNVRNEFSRMMADHLIGAAETVLMFHPREEGVDLVHACCSHYGTPREWTRADTLLLYGVLLKFIHSVPDSALLDRLRLLRNLVEASDDEIRAGERNNMPSLLADVEQVIVHGDIRKVRTFNQVQVRNEQAKSAMLGASPALKAHLHRLEDHVLLRGGLTAFDLDPNRFVQRAESFMAIFADPTSTENRGRMQVTGALLSCGDYSRRWPRATAHTLADFGAPSNDEPWQVLFRGRKTEAVHCASKSLTTLLDAFAAGRAASELIDAYLGDPATAKDWRYYLVKYDCMREGASGRYVISEDGYRVCMLNKERLSSDYYDAYLYAAVRQANVPVDRIANPKWPRCFTGSESNSRKLALRDSGVEIESVNHGWQLSGIPTDPRKKAVLEMICGELGIGEDYLLLVPQAAGFDTVDRVRRGDHAFGVALPSWRRNGRW